MSGARALSLLLVFFTSKSFAYEIQQIQRNSVGSIKGCNQSQSQSLILIEKDISQRLRDLLGQWHQFDIEGAKAQFIVPENRQYTEGAPVNQQYESYWRKMQSNFSRMFQETEKSIHLECRDMMADRYCDKGKVFAYVRFFGANAYPMIYVCSSFFSMPVDQQKVTLFHELSHYAAQSDDFAMDWWTKDSIDLNRAAIDAYHIQNFASGDVSPFLRRSIWFWLWPRGKGPLTVPRVGSRSSVLR